MVRTSGVDDSFSGIPETLLYDGRTSMSSAFVMSLCRWTTFQINIEIFGLENTKKNATQVSGRDRVRVTNVPPHALNSEQKRECSQSSI